MPAGYSFRPRLWALALAAAACAAGIALGNWQSRRADEKRVSIPRVTVEGEFLPRYTIYLDNRTRRGKAGYEVVTPLRLRSSSHVLVNRGWVEVGKTRDVLPEVNTPPGEVRIDGLELKRFPRILVLGSSTTGRLRQSLDIAAYAAGTGLKLEPRVIEQHSDTGDGLARDWPPHDAGVEKHEGYALQWYSLAALAVMLAIVLSFRKN
jgi:surfeit locus 1 family protein